jgi:hypothetical protein
MTDHPHSPTEHDTGDRTSPQSETPHSPDPTCPWCRSADVEPLALFGSQLMTQQYYCHACHTPFERIKDDR